MQYLNMLNDEEPQVPKEDGDPYTILRYGFTEDQKKEMATFGDSAVFIKNVDEFIHRVRKAAEAKVSGAGIEVNPEGVKTENLLTDILTGQESNFGDDQNVNQGQIPQGQGQEQGYYDGNQQGTVPQQYAPVPEQYQNPEGGYTNEYADPNQYYPGEQNPTTSLDEAIRYGPSENPQEQPQGVQEEYVNPDIPKDNYPPTNNHLNPHSKVNHTNNLCSQLFHLK